MRCSATRGSGIDWFLAPPLRRFFSPSAAPASSSAALATTSSSSRVPRPAPTRRVDTTTDTGRGSTTCGIDSPRGPSSAGIAKGRDVERELPKLSAYLGHAHVADTYWYIEAVPELLQLATERATPQKGGCDRRRIPSAAPGLLHRPAPAAATREPQTVLAYRDTLPPASRFVCRAPAAALPAATWPTSTPMFVGGS